MIYLLVSLPTKKNNLQTKKGPFWKCFNASSGIGVVVGSEIFNLLIIVGLTISAAPVVPLALERVPFARDCFFYALSIALLYWALLDHAIVTWKQEQVWGKKGVGMEEDAIFGEVFVSFL